MKLYVYCLAEKIDALNEPVTGISGASVKLIEVEDFSLLVSEFDGESVPVTRDNALAHAAVVRSVLNEVTPLPFRFGTVVKEEQLRSYVTARRQALESKLAQVGSAVEMSVKIIWNTDREDVTDDSEQGPGTRFLKERQRAILGGEHRLAQAKEIASWLKEQVAALLREEHVSLCPTEKLIVAAAHLIDRERIGEYKEQLTLARKTRPELHFLVSGPWPPYTFSNIDLEFKTLFGVS